MSERKETEFTEDGVGGEAGDACGSAVSQEKKVAEGREDEGKWRGKAQ